MRESGDFLHGQWGSRLELFSYLLFWIFNAIYIWKFSECQLNCEHLSYGVGWGSSLGIFLPRAWQVVRLPLGIALYFPKCRTLVSILLLCVLKLDHVLHFLLIAGPQRLVLFQQGEGYWIEFVLAPSFIFLVLCQCDFTQCIEWEISTGYYSRIQ